MEWSSLRQWLTEQGTPKEQYTLILEYSICRELFHGSGRRCSKIKSMFHFSTDALWNTAGRVECALCLDSVLPLEEAISSAKEFVCSLCVSAQEVRPSLHSCSTSGCSLWQEEPVLAASRCYHFLAPLLSVSPTFPKLIAKLTSSPPFFDDC